RKSFARRIEADTSRVRLSWRYQGKNRRAHVRDDAGLHAGFHRYRVRAGWPLLSRGLQVELAGSNARCLPAGRAREGDGARGLLSAVPRLLRGTASLSAAARARIQL